MSRRLRELAGLPRVAIKEEMAQAIRKNGKWTDGTYTEGDSITYRGLGWNLEFEPDPQGLAANRDTGQPVEGAWFAVNDIGEEVDFYPGMEDRHDPMTPRQAAFPESTQVNEATVDGVAERFAKHMDMVERLENSYKKGGLMEKAILSIGGDPAGLNDVRLALEDLYRALEEADYYARSGL